MWLCVIEHTLHTVQTSCVMQKLTPVQGHRTPMTASGRISAGGQLAIAPTFVRAYKDCTMALIQSLWRDSELIQSRSFNRTDSSHTCHSQVTATCPGSASKAVKLHQQKHLPTQAQSNSGDRTSRAFPAALRLRPSSLGFVHSQRSYAWFWASVCQRLSPGRCSPECAHSANDRQGGSKV